MLLTAPIYEYFGKNKQWKGGGRGWLRMSAGWCVWERNTSTDEQRR